MRGENWLAFTVISVDAAAAWSTFALVDRPTQLICICVSLQPLPCLTACIYVLQFLFEIPVYGQAAAASTLITIS